MAQLRWLARGAVALVWAYNGIYCKLMFGDISHLQVIASLPFVNPAFALILMAWLALFEIVLAGWVLSGCAPRWAAAVQSLTLLGMNAGGLLWASGSTPQPGAMLVQNLALVVLIWFAAAKLPEGGTHGRAHD